ncbi:hypothetical protein JL721_7876 [Aureococcus anophagefferens]|nr:hypothetical protein JL721_7876 [Aureococcus anophagefferens]
MLVCEIDARVVWRIAWEFNNIDIDRSGHITSMELFNHYAVADTVFNRRAMTIMDNEPPDKMSLDVLEYTAAVYNDCSMQKVHLLHFIFAIFDEDGSGYLEMNEFVALVNYVYGRPLTQRVLEALDKCDFTESGMITREEFVTRCNTYPMLVAPAFEMQEILHNAILGVKFWVKHIDRRCERQDDLLEKLREMDRCYMEGGSLQHVGDSMRDEEVAKSAQEKADEAAATPKAKATLEQSISFNGGRMSMRHKDVEAKLENSEYMKDLEQAEKERFSSTNVTYRPSRKPGEGPNIQRDAATYSKLIDVKKYATFRKNMEKHRIQKSVGTHAGDKVDKGGKLGKLDDVTAGCGG